MGISAVGNFDLGSNRQLEKAKVRARDVKTLAQILEPILGDSAKAEAQKLVASYKSINELFNYFAKCDPNSTDLACGAAGYLKVIAQSFSYILERDVLSGPVLPNSSSLHDYLFNSLYPVENEVFRILFLDAANRLIEDRVMSTGTVDRVNIYARQVIKTAIELNATAIVLVHNHPSGDPTPSRADVAITAQIEEACKTFDLRLIDHLVVARSGIRSMRDMGLLESKPAAANLNMNTSSRSASPLEGCRRIMHKLIGKF